MKTCLQITYKETVGRRVLRTPVDVLLNNILNEPKFSQQCRVPQVTAPGNVTFHSNNICLSNGRSKDYLNSSRERPNPNVGDFTSTTFHNVSTLSTGSAAPFTTNIPGLSGLALTPVFFSFGPQSQIDPQTHPRATEMFFVLSGFLDVGFVDTNNDLFETTVQAGDIFVFPKGMLHWQRNNGQGTATGFSALSSENPGTLLIAEALFTAGGKGLPDIVLATAFGTNTNEIDQLRGPVAQRNNVSLSN